LNRKNSPTLNQLFFGETWHNACNTTKWYL
jgi:hypothetical protein